MVVPLATIALAVNPPPYAPHGPPHPQPAPYGHPEPAPYGHPEPAPYGHPQPTLPPEAYCDPKKPPKCATDSDLPFCFEDPEYPEYEITHKISSDPIFLKKYSDVPDQSADDLVEHITKQQEDSFDYAYYTGASTGPSPFDLTHWSGPEGYLCPSQIDYIRIKRAVNVEGLWRVILQHIPQDYGYGNYNYTQTTRLETCLTPDAACRLLAPCYRSKCTQKYVYHRMVSFDPCDPYRGFFIDTYKLPSACSCHLPQ